MVELDTISLVSEEVAYFLSLENKACIPGFGRFIVEHQTASVDEDTKTLHPATSNISFVADLEESDTRFSEFFTFNHPESTIMDDFITKFVSQLSDHKKVELPELGICSINEQGALRFEPIDVNNEAIPFTSKTLQLKPVSKAIVKAEPEDLNTPGAGTPGAGTKESIIAPAKSRSSLVRIGMVLSCFTLLMIFLSKYQWVEAATAEYKKVPTNYNVSPQDQEVIIASSDGLAPDSDMGNMEDIIVRQKLMSADNYMASVSLTATIITNTFGNLDNVNKQLRLIKELGYEASSFEKSNGLISTLITLEYQTEQDLEALMIEIKKEFPRARLKY